MKRKHTSKHKKYYHRKKRNTPKLKKQNKKTRKYFVGRGPTKLPKITGKKENNNDGFISLFGIENEADTKKPVNMSLSLNKTEQPNFPSLSNQNSSQTRKVN